MRLLRASEHERPFLLLAAFAVVLLASISTTMASNASPLPLIDGLQRDLGAIRAQLERADPASFETGQQSVAFNADLATAARRSVIAAWRPSCAAPSGASRTW